jgi:hypothetical protein
MPVFSPFRPPSSPLEILQATVERTENIVWNGEPVSARLVVYRSDAGSGLLAARKPRGKLWVRSDGLVLKQQVTALNSDLTFVRLPANEARSLAEFLDSEAGEDWSGQLSTGEERAVWNRLFFHGSESEAVRR